MAVTKVSKLYEPVDGPPADRDKVKEVARSRTKKAKRTWFRTEYLWVLVALCVIGAAVMTTRYLPQATPVELRPITDSRFISAMNSRRASFTVGPVRQFGNWTKTDVTTSLGGIFATPQMDRMLPCPVFEGLPAKLPPSFDSRQKWPECFQQESYSSGMCSSSWAIAVATTVSNRACIVDPESKANIDLSPQAVLSCDSSSLGCKGAGIDSMWVYPTEKGLVKNTCFPWTASDEAKCSEKCKGETPIKITSRCKLPDENLIMREIMGRGPVVAVMTLADDIILYKNGIYEPTKETERLVNADHRPLTHVVKIIGWGVDKNVEYWLIQGSGFGGDWGDAGVMKLKKSAQQVINYRTVVAPQMTYESVNGLRSLEADFEEAEWNAKEEERKQRLKEEKAAIEGSAPTDPALNEAIEKINQMMKTAASDDSSDGDADELELVDEDGNAGGEEKIDAEATGEGETANVEDVATDEAHKESAFDPEEGEVVEE